MAILRRICLSVLFLSTCQALADKIIGADGKEYHPKRHHHQKHHHDHHHDHHHGKASSHVDAAVVSLPVAHARPVRFNLDTPATPHHHGAISSEPALQHVTAPAEHHGEFHHLRKQHKIHMLNEHNHMLNHKTEPKEDQSTENQNADAKDKKDEKKSKDESGESEESEEKEKDKAAGRSKAKWSNGKKGGPLPVQGYDEYHDGETVEHEDMKSLTSDWQKEFGPNMKGMDSYRKICEKYPDNEWCRLHRGMRQYGQPERSWHLMRSQARRTGSILSLGLLAVCLVTLQ